MKLLKPLVPVLLPVLFAACANDNDSSTRGMPIMIYPSMNTRATDTDFESGDCIGISISIDAKYDFEKNVSLVHNGTHFISPDVQWYENNREGTFEAYYPYQSVLPEEFSVASDQNGEGYMKSDLMMSRAEKVKPNASGVSMDFSHILSQVIVRVVSETPIETDKVTIEGTQAQGAVDFELMTVRPKLSSAVADLVAQKIDDGTFRLIVIPQEAQITVSIDYAGGRNVKKTFTKQNFDAGKSYIARITIDDDFDITDTEIISNGDIQPWEPGVDLVPAG